MLSSSTVDSSYQPPDRNASQQHPDKCHSDRVTLLGSSHMERSNRNRYKQPNSGFIDMVSLEN